MPSCPPPPQPPPPPPISLLELPRELLVQTARAAAGARGAPWFQRTGRSANGSEDALAHVDGAYRDNNWRSHNADRGACTHASAAVAAVAAVAAAAAAAAANRAHTPKWT
ncbi:hypothetical protein T492DRAFT_860754 [Pavlovales sp. CCMP2436]|nr:hypothetical protein T492DRAFT_860754 [Pavlovales sp. CCMP2436]